MRATFILFCFAYCTCWAGVASADEGAQLRAGAFAIDVSPTQLPAIVNGGMFERVESKVLDPLFARCVVLDDGTEQLALVVVDSCMMPRALLDRAKKAAADSTGIPEANMLISATHTHSAPSAMACLGSRQDEAYSELLPAQIARGIKLAHQRLEPARIGWAIGRDENNVACRRWLMKPGTTPTNPFGSTGDRAQMHPGYDNANKIRPTGAVDPDVGLLSIQTRDGRPMALLANYSMHYVGGPSISADYFGIFSTEFGQLAAGEQAEAPVTMLSNGTSGDAWCLDYGQPKRRADRRQVAQDLANAALEAYRQIKYYDWTPLVMEEQLLTLDVRMPSGDEVVVAKEKLAAAGNWRTQRQLGTPIVYANETVALSEMPPTRELKLQAIRIGHLGVTAIPNEVFGSTGLTIKARSPLPTTFNISLANGSEGYIPPPEQHKLGGYTTWRARTSCLEVEAEPKITAAVLQLLHRVVERRAEEELVPSATAARGDAEQRGT